MRVPWSSALEWPYATEAPATELLRGARGRLLVAVGEVHARPWILRSALLLLREMAASSVPERLALAMEMFNTEQQALLDAWQRGEIGWDTLVGEYERGPEGFPLEVYRPIMEEARKLGATLHGVMIPRPLASAAARTGEPPELPTGTPPIDPRVWPGYREALARLFPRSGPMSRLPVERLLLAQSLKDSWAARAVASLLACGRRVLLLMGWAHVEVPGSVPDRATRILGIPGRTILVIGAREARLEEYRAGLEHPLLGLISRYTLLGNRG